MGPAWAYAFVAAGFVTLAGTPLLRRLALATDFVDRPLAAHKSHDEPTPYLGGIGLIVAVLVGLLFTDRLTAQVGVVAIGGSLIGCLGLLDDHRSVGALFRFLVELGVAAVALGCGLRIHATDVPAIDGALTLVWVVGVTNAVNLLDNMDGLAAGVSAAAAAAIFSVAVLGEQFVTATVAAGLAGACVGFLTHNKRPASIFMGDAGSLFLGFVLAIVAIDVSPALGPPGSFAVPLMLLALPVLDTATVTLSRLRRGRSISQGGKDHLSHRLVALGLGPGAAVGVLVAAEGAVGLAAVLAGRDVVPLPVAVSGALGVLAVLAAVTVRADVYTEQVVGLPRRLCLGAAAALCGVVLLAAPALVSLARARGPGSEGAAQARAGLRALAAGDAGRATALFDQATATLGRAQDRLDGRLSSLGLLLPGLRANLATARAVVGAGRDVSRSASDLSALVAARSLALDDRSEAVDASERLAPAVAQSSAVLQRSLAKLAGYDRPYLWPSLDTAIGNLRTSLVAISQQAAVTTEALRAVPALLGGDGARHYFVAIQDNAELRGGGGVVRFWGEVEAASGRTQLSRFGPVDDLNRPGPARSLDGQAELVARYQDFDPANTWQNVNVSPDFSVTGQAMSSLYPQSGGRPVDGVIAVDLPGLAALVGLSGPVNVDGWPVALTGANLVDVVLRDVPRRYPADAERQAFLAGLYRQVLESVLRSDPGPPSRLAAALTDAVRSGHLRLYSPSPQEEALFETLGAAGRLSSVNGDSLLVVNQNLTATPVDADLRRSVRYDVDLDPGTRPAAVTATVEVTLGNDAATENRTNVSIYSPFGAVDKAAGFGAYDELGRRAYATSVAIPAQQSRTVTLRLAGSVTVGPGNWYRLALAHQPSLRADQTEVSLSVPSGWRIVEVQGAARMVDDRHAVARLPVSGEEGLAVRLQRTAWARLWAG